MFFSPVWDRTYHLRCASSIAAADWDTYRIPFTNKASRGKQNRGEPAGRERCITFGSRVARGGFSDTEIYPQKDHGQSVSYCHANSSRVANAPQIQTQVSTIV